MAAVGPDLASKALTVLAESDAVDAVVALGILRSPSTGWTSDDPVAAGSTRSVKVAPGEPLLTWKCNHHVARMSLRESNKGLRGPCGPSLSSNS